MVIEFRGTVRVTLADGEGLEEFLKHLAKAGVTAIFVSENTHAPGSDEEHNVFAAMIRSILQRSDVRQWEFASAAGVSQTYISRAKCGKPLGADRRKLLGLCRAILAKCDAVLTDGERAQLQEFCS